VALAIVEKLAMAVLLFSLRGVPDDEASEVRELLTANAIPFYETPAGNWGISLPAIWLPDDTHLIRARALLADYQAARGTTQREAYTQLRQKGRHRRFLDLLKENPLRVAAYLVIVAVVFYFSLYPFVNLGRQS
jgi:GrpB-like predicted nucleotidyltransferase (UPF0157 family)